MQVSNMQDAFLCFTTTDNEGRMQILSVCPPDLIQSEWNTVMPGNQLMTAYTASQKKL